MAIEDSERSPTPATEALREEFDRLFPRLRRSERGDILAALAKAKQGSTALCLSGGGIRSATFSLGVLQGLANSKRLDEYDYLSTVSGGGYIGAWLSRWRAGERDRLSSEILFVGDAADALKETPDDIRPPEHPLRRLRSFSNYLAPSWGLSMDTLTVASIFMRNLLLNFLFWVPLLLLVAMLPWVFTTISRSWVSTGGLTIGRISFEYFDIAAFGMPALMAALWMASALVILLLGWQMTEEWRERISRFTAPLLLIGIAWLLLFAAFVYLPWVVLMQIGASAGQSAFAIAGGGLFAILTGMAGYWSRYGPDLGKKAYAIADAFGARLLDLLALLALLFFAVAATLAMRAWLLLWPVPTTEGEAGPAVYWVQADADAWIFGYTALGLALIVTAAGFFVGANRFSLHALYGSRLVRAYLGSARKSRNPSRATDFDPRDNVDMTALPGGKDWPEGKPLRPFHVVNMTLNLARSRRDELDWQERKGASFTATPIHCGSPATGYMPSESFGGANDMGTATGMTLGRAMTISGAAASPNMGYHGSPLMALVMTFFNIRLGWWVPNPEWLAKRDAPLYRQEPLYGLGYVLKEAFSGADRHSNWLYLSDGGHFDNLGLYEMVRRRCRHIVVVDAGCDGEFKYADLHNAIRKIAVDLAVPIELNADLPGQKGPAERQRIAVGTIRYKALDPHYKDGKLFVIKPVLVGDEPPALREYAEASRRWGKTFPHHSTVDQFFNETQFESYRRLGEWSVADLRVAMTAKTAPSALAGASADGEASSKVVPPERLVSESSPPPAMLSGVESLATGMRSLGTGQLVFGAIAAVSVAGATLSVADRAADRAINAMTGSGGSASVGEQGQDETGNTAAAPASEVTGNVAQPDDRVPTEPQVSVSPELLDELRSLRRTLEVHVQNPPQPDARVDLTVVSNALRESRRLLARYEEINTTNQQVTGSLVANQQATENLVREIRRLQQLVAQLRPPIRGTG